MMQPIGVEAREPRGARRCADDPDLEALDGAAEQHRRDHDDDQRQHRAEVKARALGQDRDRRDRIEFGGGREIEAVGIAPGPAHQIVEAEIGDIDQHQARENLARAEVDLAQRRDQPIKRAADRA